MKRALTICLVTLATTARCSGDGSSTGDGSTDPAASFCATLRGPGKEAMGGVACVVCSPYGCQNERSDKAGKVCVAVSRSGDHVFHATESEVNGARYGDVLFPISISAETFGQKGVRDLGTVTMPRVGPTSILNPKSGGTFALGGGLTLSVPAGVATPPPFEKKIELAVARVDAADLHPNLTATHGGGKSPALTYTFVPDEVSFSSPVSFEIAGSGLSSGTTLDVYWIDYKTARPTLHGQATVTKSGTVVDVKGQGLKLLGWFLFYEK